MKRLIVFLISTFLLVSCSGGNNVSDPVQTNQVEIKAFVIDPAVKNSRVELQDEQGTPVIVCGANDNQLCTRWSGEDGSISLFIDKDYDLSGHRVIAFGGVDTEFGYNLEGLEMAAELDLFSDIGNIIISPATTLLYHLREAGAADPEAALKAALGIPNADLAGNPMDEAELLKASYLVMKVALLQNSADENADAMGVIAGAIVNAPGKLLSDSDLLDFTALTADDKVAVSDTADMLENLPSGSTPAELISMIAFNEKVQIYDSAFALLLDDYASPHSGNYEANLKTLVEKIDALVEGGVPVDSFIISQLARFITGSDDSIDTYAEIDSMSENDFAAKLDTLAADNDFVSSVSFLASEGVYMTSVPATPLGLDDNDARVNYYFNSDADVNYLARKLASEIGWDSLSDSTYLNIISFYTKYGFYQRAENYAKTYVFGSENRSKAYRNIGMNMVNYDTAKGVEYVRKAEDILDNIASAPTLSSDEYKLLAENYISLVNAYRKLGDTSESLRLFNWLIDLDNGLLSNLDNEVSSSLTQFTAYGRLISAQKSLVDSYIDSGEYEDGILANDRYVELIGNLVPNTKQAEKNPYASHILYCMYAMRYYMQLDDGSDSAALKSKTLDIYSKMLALKEKNLAVTNPQTTWENYFAQAAGALAWAKDDPAYAKTEIMDKLTTASYKSRAAYEIMVATSDGTFADAKSIYETATPLDTVNYSNLNTTQGYVPAFTYTSLTNPGLAMRAANNGNAAMANEALAYLRGILDGAANKYITNSTPIANRVVLVSTDEDLGTEIKKYTQSDSSRYIHNGYIKVARVYYINGNTAEAENTLAKAKAYIDTFADSYIKSTNFAAIGSFYLEMGNSAKAAELFAAAAAVTMPATSLSKDYAIFYLGLAQDAVLIKDFTKARAYLDTAKPYLTDIYSGGVDEDAAKIQTYLWKIAGEYYFDIQDRSEGLAALKNAIDAAQNITVEKDRKTYVEYIVSKYGQNRAVEEGKKEIWALYTSTSDRKDLVAKMLGDMIDNNDFDGSEIAFLDTDNDGKPDFFAPWATAQQIADSGLVLDDDIDGDGITDDIDTMPYYKN